jgi:hypothetical protein
VQDGDNPIHDDMGRGGDEPPQKRSERLRDNTHYRGIHLIRVVKTTLKAISFEKRQGILDGCSRYGETYKGVERPGTATMGTAEV